MTATVKVVIHGPSGMPIDGPAIHVHAAGCADLKRRPIYRATAYDAWNADVSNWLDLVATMYPPDEFMYDIDNKSDRSPYENDIRAFPCVVFPGESAATDTPSPAIAGEAGHRGRS